MSMAIHAAVFTLLMVGATNTTVRKSIEDRLTLVDPALKPYLPQGRKAGAAVGRDSRCQRRRVRLRYRSSLFSRR